MEYETWLTAHQHQKVVYPEIGVGYNTPGIIRYSFWQQVYQVSEAACICLNMEDSPIPRETADRSIVLSGDYGQIIRELVS